MPIRVLNLCQCKKSKDPCLVEIQKQQQFTVDHNASALHKTQMYRTTGLICKVQISKLHVTIYFIYMQ